MNSDRRSRATPASGGVVSVGLLIALFVQNAVPPFATDMYTPAFPEVTRDMGVSASLIGFTLTAFFIGFGTGQVAGGAASDQYGRRIPMIIGGLACTAGGLICAVAPSIWVLFAGRIIQGLGGGAAAAIGRAVLVDVAKGDALAKAMSLLMALQGLAPMVAPVLGGVIVTHTTWRVVFWSLVGFGVLMVVLAWFLVPESLPPADRHTGGLRTFVHDARDILSRRRFIAYMGVAGLSGLTLFSYISNASYTLQEQLGMDPMTFSLVFGGNALVSVVLAIVNARLVGTVQVRRLIGLGLSVSTVGVTTLAVTIFAEGTALPGVVVGFLLVMAAQAFIFGNSSAQALAAARDHAGTASAVVGLAQSTASAVAAPIATLGGSRSSVPMVVLMMVGLTATWLLFRWSGRVRDPNAGGRI